MRWEVIIKISYFKATRVFESSQEAINFAEMASQLRENDGEFVEIICRPFAEEGEF